MSNFYWAVGFVLVSFMLLAQLIYDGLKHHEIHQKMIIDHKIDVIDETLLTLYTFMENAQNLNRETLLLHIENIKHCHAAFYCEMYTLGFLPKFSQHYSLKTFCDKVPPWDQQHLSLYYLAKPETYNFVEHVEHMDFCLHEVVTIEKFLYTCLEYEEWDACKKRHHEVYDKRYFLIGMEETVENSHVLEDTHVKEYAHIDVKEDSHIDVKEDAHVDIKDNVNMDKESSLQKEI